MIKKKKKEKHIKKKKQKTPKPVDSGSVFAEVSIMKRLSKHPHTCLTYRDWGSDDSPS